MKQFNKHKVLTLAIVALKDSPTCCKIRSKTSGPFNIDLVLLAAVTIIFDCCGPTHAIFPLNVAADAANTPPGTACCS